MLDGPLVFGSVWSCTIKYAAAWVPRTSARLRSQPRLAGGVYVGAGPGHWVSRTLDGGRVVVLEDGSLWEIDVLGRIHTMLWLPVDRITVLDGGSPLYPYRLVDTSAGDVVEAKYLGR